MIWSWTVCSNPFDIGSDGFWIVSTTPFVHVHICHVLRCEWFDFTNVIFFELIQGRLPVPSPWKRGKPREATKQATATLVTIIVSLTAQNTHTHNRWKDCGEGSSHMQKMEWHIVRRKCSWRESRFGANFNVKIECNIKNKL